MKYKEKSQTQLNNYEVVECALPTHLALYNFYILHQFQFLFLQKIVNEPNLIESYLFVLYFLKIGETNFCLSKFRYI